MLQSPFHRSLALSLHSELLLIPSIRSSILETLSLSLLPGTQNRDILGAWLVTALEEGRRAGASGIKRWEESTTWLESSDELADSDGRINLKAQLPYFVQYLSLAVLDPPSLHDDIHPSPVQSAFPGTKAPVTKGKKKGLPMPVAAPVVDPEEDQVAEERWTRYRVGGLVGLSWLLQQLSKQNTPLPEDLLTLLGNSYLWTAISPSPGQQGDETMGGRQAVIRRAGWDLLETLVNCYPAEVEKKEMLDMLAVAVLDNCWAERDSGVWVAAGPAVAKFLSSKSRWMDGADLQNTGTPGRLP
jgi:hypothetical protein